MEQEKHPPKIVIRNTLTGKEMKHHFVSYRKERIPGVYAPDDLGISQHRFTPKYSWFESSIHKALQRKYPDKYPDRNLDNIKSQ